MPARYAIIGDPVAHSLSPAMQNAAFAAYGIDATYVPLRVSRDELRDAMERLRDEYAGFNVTTPLKELTASVVDALTEVAQDAAAVNTVRVEKRRLTGHNTDGSGFVAAIAELWNLKPRGKMFCLLGSGPAARAIAQSVAKAGASRVMCWSRNPLTASEVGPLPDSRPDVLVCALPVDAQIPPDVLDVIEGAEYVFDVNYRAVRSPISPEVGRHRSDGLPMLLHQGAQSFHWWTGQSAPLEIMRSTLA